MKYIKGYEGLYCASYDGEIIICPRERLYGKTKVKTEGKVKRCHIGSKGYYLVSLTKDKKQKTYSVHRLIAETLIPNPEKKPFVNHKNGNRTDNRVENLEWVTSSENVLHSYRTLNYSPSEYTRNKRRIKMSGRTPHINNIDANGTLIINLNSGVYHHSINEASKAYNISVRLIKKRLNKGSFIALA